MTVVVATIAAVAIVVTATIAVVIAPSAPTVHRAKMASHPSRVSQEAIAPLANLEQIAHRVSRVLLANRVQKASSNASHVNLGPNEHHAPRVLTVQTCANHAKAMHQP
jgi:hypothetical protein